ncbi:hypothetical protein D3C83_161640 [compost metagenome]
MIIRQFLYPFFRAALFILGYAFVFYFFLERMIGITPDIAYGNLGFLSFCLDDFN